MNPKDAPANYPLGDDWPAEHLYDGDGFCVCGRPWPCVGDKP